MNYDQAAGLIGGGFAFMAGVFAGAVVGPGIKGWLARRRFNREMMLLVRAEAESKAAYERQKIVQKLEPAEECQLIIKKLQLMGFLDQVRQKPCGRCGHNSRHGDNDMLVCIRCVPTREEYEDLLAL